MNGVVKRGLYIAAILAVSVPAHAASAVNMGSQSQTIVVNDGSGQSEISVAPGENVQFCQNGCLVILPDGEQQALTGAESITLTDPAPTPDNSDNSGN